ncbi:MAG: heme exporter protein CcmD [Rhodospirillales bacterium]|jgi:heme exporter protein D|nr:heme exporter protein CcmD [Rhodospirillales bacterium]
MENLTHYFAMGGYAAFVWPAYAVALIVLGGMALQSLRAYWRNLRQLETLQQERPGRRRGAR